MAGKKKKSGNKSHKKWFGERAKEVGVKYRKYKKEHGGKSSKSALAKIRSQVFSK